MSGPWLLHHLVVGDLDLPDESLPLAAGSSTSLVADTPDPHSPAHDTLALLASWAAGDAGGGSSAPGAQPARSRRHETPSDGATA